MECAAFERCFEGLLEGSLPEAAKARCLAHAAGCPRCAELLELAGLSAEEAPQGFAAEVMARTVGSACPAARERLCELADGEVEAAERRLVEVHLAGCADCRATLVTLRGLARELPQLARLDPGAGFTEQVLAATLPLPSRLRRWWGRVATGWAHRPRIASESAFAAVLVLLLVLQATGTRLAALPPPGDLIAEVGRTPVVERATAAVLEWATPMVETVEAKVEALVETARAIVEDIRERLAPWWRAARDTVGTFSSWAASLLASGDQPAAPARDGDEPEEAPS